jgi:hypothetical protein
MPLQSLRRYLRRGDGAQRLGADTDQNAATVGHDLAGQVYTGAAQDGPGKLPRRALVEYLLLGIQTATQRQRQNVQMTIDLL